MQCLGGFLEQIEDRAVLRPQAAQFGIGEAPGGKLEGSEIDEDVAGMREALLKPAGKRPDQRSVLRVGAHGWQRFCQQTRPFRIRGRHPKGGNEGERFVLTQGVALGSADEVLLASLAHGAQGIGERRPDRPLLDLAPDARSKFRGQGKPAHDPGFAPAEQLCNPRQTEPVLVEQGLNDARLIHRRRRAWRGVRTQHEKLLLDRRAGRLDRRRHNRSTLVHPASEPFETVDDLEKAVSCLNDANGKITELWRR